MNQKFNIYIAALAILFISTASIFANEDNYTDPNQIITLDKATKTGTLPNGIKYYIKKNKKPEKRMELRLVVNAGSVQEDDDQQGIAHFLEHMCFNGTKNFPKNELINFLEKTGVKFGAHLNAYTSFDRTVYMLLLPTDQSFIKKKGFQVLSDWAHNVTFDPKEIDRERGVVREEERVRKNGNSKAQQEHFPFLFYQSKLANRLPIGDTNIIRTAPYEAFTRFYKDWYRADLMSVVVVGDIDESDAEDLIKEYFGEIPAASNPKKKEDFSVKMNQETLVSISKDKEVTFPVLQIVYKHPITNKAGTYAEYRQKWVDQFIGGMISQRMQEVAKRANPPFQQAGFQADKELGNYYGAGLFAVLKSEDLMRGYGAALTELFRAYKNGFNQSEFDRVKKEAFTSLENAFNEKDKTESRSLADEFIRHILDGESAPGVERDFNLYKKWSEEITLAELNARIKQLITKDNMVLTLTAPEKDGVKIPSKEELLKVYTQIASKNIDAYKDDMANKAFFTKKLIAGTIKSETKNDKQGITTWTLSNGAKVYFKNTDFSNDEISFRAYSRGGHSLCSDADFNSAATADDIINSCGLGEFNSTQLPKILAGKTVEINPMIGDYNEGFTGRTNAKDMETFFQALNMYFTAPRVDKDGFESYISNSKDAIKNQKVNPNAVYQDSISAIMSGYHLRRMPVTPEFFDKIDMNKAFELYKQRFADASNFTFFFVGNIDEDKFKTNVLTYLASLPSTNSNETWKEMTINEPKGTLRKVVNKGKDPKGVITMIIPGKFENNEKNRYMMSALTQVLSIRLREQIREEKGGAYGVGVFPQMTKYPKSTYKLNVQFTCPPERVDELVAEVKNVLKEVQTKDVSDDNLTKVKETQKRERETSVKENRSWMNWIYNYTINDEDINNLDSYDKLVNGLSKADIKKAANDFINFKEIKEFILLPESN